MNKFCWKYNIEVQGAKPKKSIESPHVCTYVLHYIENVKCTLIYTCE